MRGAAGVLAAVSLVHLGAQAAGGGAVAELSQVLLMPALAAVLLTGTWPPRSREVRLVLVALGFSGLGDSLPRLTDGTAAFLLMLGGFLVAQGVYAVAFWPARAGSVLARRPVLVPLYPLATGSVVALCAPAAGPLLPALVLYALAITAMAVLATGLGRLAGGGAVVFLVSDTLIALDAFGVLTPPLHQLWVMSTYLAAQVLLVAAVLRREKERDDGRPRRARRRGRPG